MLFQSIMELRNQSSLLAKFVDNLSVDLPFVLVLCNHNSVTKTAFLKQIVQVVMAVIVACMPQH